MKIPNYLKKTMKTMENAGFDAYVVGGCVRDILINTPATNTPKDWDITTNALPGEIQVLFPESVYENNFGTVGVKIKKEGETIDVLEITTYRTESTYTDKRHPDNIKFTNKIEKDLGRRDFTINSMAMDLKNLSKHSKIQIIDPFNGKDDLKNKIIRTVGDPKKRFSEDALRMIRAIRFAVVLDFKIEKNTLESIKKNASLIRKIANERIKDEFIKILKSKTPEKGIILLKETGLLHYIFPEIEKTIGIKQNKHHTYTVFKHLLLSLKYCPSNDYRVKLAALLHDIAKPQTKKGTGNNATFYNHEIVGSKVAFRLMKRLAFSNEDIKIVTHLIKNHMFYYNVDEVSEAGVRRLLKKVGKENMKDLMDLRISDRLGSGVPKAKPYKLRHLEYLIEKVSNDPISIKSLKINGETLIKDLKMNPGPTFGAILDILLAEVIETPEKNNKTYLKKRVLELEKDKIKEIRKIAKNRIEKKKKDENKAIKKKYWVK